MNDPQAYTSAAGAVVAVMAYGCIAMRKGIKASPEVMALAAMEFGAAIVGGWMAARALFTDEMQGDIRWWVAVTGMIVCLFCLQKSWGFFRELIARPRQEPPTNDKS